MGNGVWRLEVCKDDPAGTVSAVGDTYPHKDMFRAEGFRFVDTWPKRWRAPYSVASKFWKYAVDPDLKARLQAMQSTRAQALDASRAADANIDIPKPSDQEYMPFQRAGVAYALGRKGTLIGDEMGLGKTVQGCGLINAVDARRVLIVCPASLRLVWKRHVQSWLVRRLPVFLARGRKDRQFERAVEMNCEGVYILNYDVAMAYVGVTKKLPDDFATMTEQQQALAKKAARWDRKGASGCLMRMNWDLVIGDEIHLVKNHKAQRTVAFTCLRGERRLGLTGTPICNTTDELYTIVNWIDPEAWTWNAFKNFDVGSCSYSVGDPCGRCSKCKTLAELQNRLRETIMVRRLKRDVLTELPAKRRQIVEVEPEGDAVAVVARSMLQWQAVAAKLAAAEAAAKAAQERHDEEAYRKAVDQLNGAISVKFEEMSIVRRDLAIAKIPYAISHVDAVLESVDKVVVFAHHHEVIDALSAHYGAACVVVDGRVAKDKRQACVDAFQKDPKVRVFIGGIIPAGVGITLTAASHVIFVEGDWVPGNMTQAEDRCHRIGQSDSVLVQHLVFNDSLESKMATVVVDKQRVIEMALDKGQHVAPPVVVPEPPKEWAEAVKPAPVQSENDYATTAELPF